MSKENCTMNGLLIKPCESLANATNDPQGHYKKGLSIMPITQVKKVNGKTDFVHTRDFLIVKNGEYQKKGILCNFCPFCGSGVYVEKVGSEVAETERTGSVS